MNDRRAEELALSGVDRVTLSLDGVKPETVNLIRGRDDFYERLLDGIESLVFFRQKHSKDFEILLKTVVMSHNIEELEQIAMWAEERGCKIQFQPIEENYQEQKKETQWWLHSEKWPKDSNIAVKNIQKLIDLKAKGYSIQNSIHSLQTMQRYFEDPAPLVESVAKQVAVLDESFQQLSSLLHFEIAPDGTFWRDKGIPWGNFRKEKVVQTWKEKIVPEIFERTRG